MYRTILATVAVLGLSATISGAATLSEAEYGEFSDDYASPTNFTGYSTVIGNSNGHSDFEYFWIESIKGGDSLSFTLTTTEPKGKGPMGSDMLIRLSPVAFSHQHWDHSIDHVEFDRDPAGRKARELKVGPPKREDNYTFIAPEDYEGPLYGLAFFHHTKSPSSFRMDANISPVPLPGALGLMVVGLAGVGAASRRRRKAA